MFFRRSGRIAFAIAAVLLAVAVPPLLVTSAKGETMAETAKLSEAEVTAIKKAFETASEALGAADWPVWSAFWAEDAVLMPPNHPRIEGLEKIRKFVQADLSNLKAFKPSDWTFEGRGDMAVVTTAMEWTFKDGTAKTGKQMVLMAKDADGAWRAQKVIYNLNGAP